VARAVPEAKEYFRGAAGAHDRGGGGPSRTSVNVEIDAIAFIP
jgi:hypothetical protein